MTITLPKENWFEIIEIISKESDGLQLSDFDNLIERGKALSLVVSQIRAQLQKDSEFKDSLEKIKEYVR